MAGRESARPAGWLDSGVRFLFKSGPSRYAIFSGMTDSAQNALFHLVTQAEQTGIHSPAD